jgi:hypothetical protein
MHRNFGTGLKKTLMAVRRPTYLENTMIHSMKFNSVWMPLKTYRSANRASSPRFVSGRCFECADPLITFTDLFPLLCLCILGISDCSYSTCDGKSDIFEMRTNLRRF